MFKKSTAVLVSPYHTSKTRMFKMEITAMWLVKNYNILDTQFNPTNAIQFLRQPKRNWTNSLCDMEMVFWSVLPNYFYRCYIRFCRKSTIVRMDMCYCLPMGGNLHEYHSEYISDFSWCMCFIKVMHHLQCLISHKITFTYPFTLDISPHRKKTGVDWQALVH